MHACKFNDGMRLTAYGANGRDDTNTREPLLVDATLALLVVLDELDEDERVTKLKPLLPFGVELSTWLFCTSEKSPEVGEGEGEGDVEGDAEGCGEPVGDGEGAGEPDRNGEQR